MPRYTVQHRYQSNRDGTLWGPYEVGQEIDLREDDAAWLNTDSPGLLVLYVEPTPEPEPEPAKDPAPEPDSTEREATPPPNRMYRGGRRRTEA